MEETKEVGQGQAVASLVLGITSILCLCGGVFAPVSIILAIVGLVFAKKAKKLGNESGLRKAGLVLGIIGLVLGIIVTAVMIGTILIAKSMITSFINGDGYDTIIEALQRADVQEVLSVLDESTREELIELIKEKNFLKLFTNLKAGEYNEVLEKLNEIIPGLSIDVE